MTKEKDNSIAKQEPVQSLTKDHIIAFKAIAASKTRIALDQEAVSDDIKALAERLGWKTKKVSSVLATMKKEEQQGGIIKESEEVLDFTRQILNIEE